VRRDGSTYCNSHGYQELVGNGMLKAKHGKCRDR
jgi:hypothetical protein